MRGFALVTGGTRGIGLAIARRLAQDGFELGLLYSRDQQAAEHAVQELSALGRKVVAIQADVGDPRGSAAAVLELEARLQRRVSVLVNNAGIVDDALLLFTKPEQLERLFQVNLHGAIMLARACLKPMIAAKAGVIVNVVSPSALHGRPGQSIYAATKGGLLSFTKTLAEEVGPLGIRVNALSPGLIDTDLLRRVPDKLREELLARVPMGRLGRPEEVAAACALLVRATYVNGTVVAVDGGLT